jgi:hypothetical protein
VDDKKIWSITKDYERASFPDDDSSLGYKISVYQESINQSFSEYLVNYKFFIDAMEKYGFIIVPRNEAKTLGLPEGSGMFIELYHMMMDEINSNPKKAVDYKDAPSMRKYEKDISFLNRYFVFKKVRTINAEKLTNTILGALPSEYEFEAIETKKAKVAIGEAQKAEVVTKEKTKPKALRRKLVLVEATEARDEPEESKLASISNPNTSLENVLKTAVKKPRTKKALITENEPVLEKEKEKEKEKKTTTRKKKASVEFNIEEDK